MSNYFLSLAGGILIGIAVSLMLYLNGRVTGISGIIYSATLNRVNNQQTWRWIFLAGLFLGGLFLSAIDSDFFHMGDAQPTWILAAGGLLVGFGTALGSGCTSGHGVCGISRMSLRSLLATVLFITAGVTAVYFFRTWGLSV